MTKVFKYEKVLAVPEEKLASYREAFDMFDSEKTGEISVDQICKIMKNFGNPVPKDEIKTMIQDIDLRGTGLLSFEDFVCFIQKRELILDEDDIILRAFMEFDKDNSGYISEEEFRYICTHLAKQLPNEMIDEILEISDLSQNGKINYRDFISFWKKQ